MTSEETNEDKDLTWQHVAQVDEVADGRVRTVTAGVHCMALTHIDGEFTAMDNRCPHQGGPLCEGSIEYGKNGQCWLRCPRHGWDFDPKTDRPPGGHEDSGQRLFPADVREDGIYVGLEADAPHARTVSDVMAATQDQDEYRGRKVVSVSGDGGSASTWVISPPR